MQHGKRPVFGDSQMFNNDPHWRDLIPFYEYFHGDTGRGCGASHQTGWTGLIAQILIGLGEGYTANFQPPERKGDLQRAREATSSSFDVSRIK